MEEFINSLKEKHNSNLNLIDEVAQVLDIKYDASYRRVTGNAKFSLEEAVILSEHFDISLDSLKKQNQNKYNFLNQDNSLKNIHQIANYLEKSYALLKPFENSKSSVVYSSKDIPIFHTLGNSILSRFKMYSWTWMLDETFPNKKLKFYDFHLPKKLVDYSEKLKNLYRNISITEFWNSTILDSIFYQVTYFYELNLLTKFEVKQIQDELELLLIEAENKLQQINNQSYSIYLNEMLLMNNSILFSNKKKSLMLIPLNILGFIKVEEPNIINEQLRYFELQKQNSISLSTTNQKQRTIFFNLLRTKSETFFKNIK
ncbi:MAG: hypothetical protein H6604_08465 [Flavobacteriales bacterium]|nr:hypothetical protein [Flavobacteriales bacterium]